MRPAARPGRPAGPSPAAGPSLAASDGLAAGAGLAGGPRAPRRRRPLALGVVVLALAAVVAGWLLFRPGPSASASAAPDVAGPVAGGGHYSLAAERGHWVLVNFFASWCTDCKAELAQLADLQRRQPAGLHVVSVDGLDDSLTKAARLIHGSGASWPLVNDPAALEAYRVSSLPQSFLVSPEGKVTDHVFGGVKAATVAAKL